MYLYGNPGTGFTTKSGSTPVKIDNDVTAWNHATVTYDQSNATVRFYLNGRSLQESEITLAEQPDPSDRISFGQEWDNNSPSGFYKGAFAEIRVWNDIRTPLEIAENMYTDISPDAEGLITYYDLREGSGTVITDQKNNADGTLVNGVAWSTELPDFFSNEFRNSELLLYLDASNPNSYPGSGTTWTSLSADQTAYTLSGSPVFDSEGYFDFDGVDDYAEIGTILNAGDSYRLEAEIYIPSETSSQNRNVFSSNRDPIWYYNNGSGWKMYHGIGGSYFANSVPVDENVWRTFVLSSEDFNDASRMGFLGDSGWSSENTTITQSLSGDPFYVGSHYVDGPRSFWDGNIRSVKLYRFTGPPQCIASGSITITTGASSPADDWQVCDGKLIPLQNDPSVNVSEVSTALQSAVLRT